MGRIALGVLLGLAYHAYFHNFVRNKVYPLQYGAATLVSYGKESVVDDKEAVIRNLS